MISLGDTKISGLYLGETKIQRAYLGEELIYEGIKKPSRLPEWFTEVDYIQISQNDCGINTGVNPNLSSTRIVLELSDLTFTSVSSGEFIFGGYGSRIAGAYRYCNLFMVSQTDLCWRDAQSTYHQKTVDVAGKRMTIDYDAPSAKLTVGTDVFAMTTYPYSIKNPTYIGIAASVDSAATFKLHSCQMYSDGEQLRDFVPCTNPSKESGLYDLINGAFYGNAFSGKLTPGPAV